MKKRHIYLLLTSTIILIVQHTFLSELNLLFSVHVTLIDLPSYFQQNMIYYQTECNLHTLPLILPWSLPCLFVFFIANISTPVLYLFWGIDKCNWDLGHLNSGIQYSLSIIKTLVKAGHSRNTRYSITQFNDCLVHGQSYDWFNRQAVRSPKENEWPGKVPPQRMSSW